MQNGVSNGRRPRWCMLDCVRHSLLFFERVCNDTDLHTTKIDLVCFLFWTLGLPVHVKFLTGWLRSTMFLYLSGLISEHIRLHTRMEEGKNTWEHRARISCNDFRFSDSYDTLAWAAIGRMVACGSFLQEIHFVGCSWARRYRFYGFFEWGAATCVHARSWRTSSSG
jgi:hypothetical protein